MAMIRFTKAAKKPKKPKKQPQSSLDLLGKLNSYLNQTEPDVVQFLINDLNAVGNTVTYKELREAYLSGGITQSQLEEWQKKYSQLVTGTLKPQWEQAAALAAQEAKNQYPYFVYEPAKSEAISWIKDHGAELVTNLARDQMDALNAMIGHFSGYTAVTPDEAARQMRACIGLTKPQALANLRYHDTIKAEYMKQHPKAKETTAEKKAQEAAARYAGRQHRYRAQSIARTELASGYNAGMYGATKDAQAQGYIGICKKKWLTAYDERVCPVCSAMDEETVDMDAMFSNGKLLPPGHPQCRCAVAYEETEPPKQGKKTQETDPRINDLETKLQDARQRLEAKKNELAAVPAYNPTNPSQEYVLQMDIASIESEIQRLQQRLDLINRHPGHTDPFLDIMEWIESNNVPAKEVKLLPRALKEEEIIERLAGGDMTGGSCSSLAFSYIGNKNGLDVLDFRGGISRDCFSRNAIIQKFGQLDGVKANITMVKQEAKDTAKLLLQTLEEGKEYYLAVGRHASIVRKSDHGLEYLELQSRYRNGWTPFGANDTISAVESTLRSRFACRKTPDRQKIFGTTVTYEKRVILMDVDSFKGNTEFREILSYINTDPGKQKKGESGSVK